MSFAPELAPPPAPPSPPALRHRVTAWKDPRLLLGVVLVTGSVLLGSVVLAHADDTVAVWSARHALPAGSRIAAGDLERRAVRLPDGDLERYAVARGAAPVGARIGREVGPGELLPRAAIAGGRGRAGVQVPLTVGTGDLPGATRVGATIDVWVADDGAGDGPPEDARRVLSRVVVLGVSQRDDPLAPTTTRSLVVSVPDDVDLARVLGAVTGSRVVVTLEGDR